MHEGDQVEGKGIFESWLGLGFLCFYYTGWKRSSSEREVGDCCFKVKTRSIDEDDRLTRQPHVPHPYFEV